MTLTIGLLPLPFGIVLGRDRLFCQGSLLHCEQRAADAQCQQQHHGQSAEAGQCRFAFTPPPAAFQLPDRSRVDRFSVQIPAQFRHQFVRRPVTPSGILLQTLQTDGLQVHIQSRVQLTRCHRFLLQHSHQRVHHIRRLKRRTTRQQRV